MKELVSLLPLLAIVVLFWALVIRPASRRNKEVALLQASLAAGDEVMLTSGFYGTVREIHDDRLAVALADGVVVQVARGAVARRVTTGETVEGD